MADPTLLLWDELEAAETLVGDGSGSPTRKNARHALERVRRSVRPGGMSAGDKHSVARFRTQVADIVASVDVTPPNTTILTGPSGNVTGASQTWTFSSTEPNSTFEVKLDSGSWGPASDGDEHTETGISIAAHTFYVRATDEDHNVDATPASQAFTRTA